MNKISIHSNMSMDEYYGHPPHQLGNGMLKLSEKWNVLFLKFVMKQSLYYSMWMNKDIMHLVGKQTSIL